jgi:hypothetical protein
MLHRLRKSMEAASLPLQHGRAELHHQGQVAPSLPSDPLQRCLFLQYAARSVLPPMFLGVLIMDLCAVLPLLLWQQ